MIYYLIFIGEIDCTKKLKEVLPPFVILAKVKFSVTKNSCLLPLYNELRVIPSPSIYSLSQGIDDYT